MNHTAIKRHFHRKGVMTLIEKYEDGYLISDGTGMWRIEADAPVLADRTRFPRLPEQGQTLRKSDLSDDWSEHGPVLSELFNVPPEAQKLTLTNLIHETMPAADDSRLLTREGGDRPVLMSTRLMGLLGKSISELKSYEYQQVRDGQAVYVLQGELVAIIMPQAMRTEWLDEFVAALGYERQREGAAA